jgi:hypothetical protein
MKKALVVLLILAVAGGAFAQLKFTGEVKTGLGVVYDNASSTAYLDAFSRDGEQPFQFRLNGAYANEGDTAGVKFRLQQRAAFSVDYAFGYLNAFGNKLTLQGGKVDDGTFNSGGGILDADSGEGVGTNILIKPIDNLVIGLGAYAANSLPLDGAYTPYKKLDDAKYTAGLSFTLPEVVKIAASFRTKNALTADAAAHNQTIASVNILALSDLGLKLILEGRFTDLGEDDKHELMDVDGFLTVGYVKDALSLGLNAALYQAELNHPTKVPDPVIAFWLYGSYAVTESIVPRLDALFMLNSYADNFTNITGGQNKWHYKNFNRDAGTAGDKNQKLVAFRPAVLLKMDANNSIEIGDYLGVHINKNKVAAWDSDTLITNAFYIDYVLKF